MKRLARLFTHLTLACLVLGGLALLSSRDAPVTSERPTSRPPVTTPEAPRDTALQGPVDYILIEKSRRLMTAMRDGRPLKTYDIALGFAPAGDKLRQGDGKTPEGLFRIDRRNPQSAYHLSLGIDYPQAEDRARARAQGVDPGGDIFIHGQPNQFSDATKLAGDWTAGCIAITNAEIRELFAATQTGATVEIRP